MKRFQGTKGIIIIVILVSLVVGYYYYLSHRPIEEKEEVDISEVQDLLLRDLDRNYPPSPKEVLKYFFDISSCLYNGNLSDHDVEALGIKFRELLDDELILVNPTEEYLKELKSEIAVFHETDTRIMNYGTSSSVDVEYFEEDGHSFARLYGTYYLIVNSNLTSQEYVYLLREDENKHWKIYGWQAVSDETNQQGAQ